jgi:hypothetical protein
MRLTAVICIEHVMGEQTSSVINDAAHACRQKQKRPERQGVFN